MVLKQTQVSGKMVWLLRVPLTLDSSCAPRICGKLGGLAQASCKGCSLQNPRGDGLARSIGMDGGNMHSEWERIQEDHFSGCGPSQAFVPEGLGPREMGSRKTQHGLWRGSQ